MKMTMNMIEQELRERIISLVHSEVVPAIGCTEPMSVALCTAKATEKLGCRPERIEALLSANILKNAMGVGIPGTKVSFSYYFTFLNNLQTINCGN